MMDQIFYLEDCSPWKTYTRVEQKWKYKKAEEGLAERYYVLNIPVSLCYSAVFRGVGNEGVKLILGKWGRKGLIVMFHFVSHYLTIF